MRLGVDIGGTFTDLVLQEEGGRLRRWKTPSTPPAFEQGVFDGIELVAASLGTGVSDLLARTEEFLHATTVTTNVVLTRKGERVSLITTRGFGDLYQLARMYRNQQRDPSEVTHPVPLVPRDDVEEVLERVDYQGRVVVPLDEDGARRAIASALDKGIRSFAVCFLWSFRNPAHEQRVKELILEQCPDAYVATSFEAAPLIGEYERMSTAVITAFTGPELRAYTGKLLRGLSERGFEGQLLLMKSDGGLGSIDNTVTSAGQTIYSGPVAGVLASKALGEDVGDNNLITFDMGGTSTDVALIEDGDVRSTSLQFLDRQALATTMVDVTTVGAGGGSLATVGPDGALHVGPESAGALPGPVCYGRGGELPTVTDANLVLGLIDPDYFLGGEMKLDSSSAGRSFGPLAAELELSIIEAAAGVFRIVNARMADAVRLRTVFAGLDPRRFSLVSFGGAGGLHCASVARELGMERVIVPAFASVFSASGLISTDLAYSVNRSTRARLEAGGIPEPQAEQSLEELFKQLANDAKGSLAEHAIDDDQTELVHSLELAYAGQSLNFEVELGSGAPDIDSYRRAAADFDERYAATYGTGAAAPENGYDIKTCRVMGIGNVARPPAIHREPTEAVAAPEPVGYRDALADGADSELSEVAVYRIESMGPGAGIEGPAIVELRDSTILIPRRCKARIDVFANLQIEVNQ